MRLFILLIGLIAALLHANVQRELEIFYIKFLELTGAL
jgi:hypothetical protein